jgi:hypothetical protein
VVVRPDRPRIIGRYALAIEHDLYRYTDPRTARLWSVVAHGESMSGQEHTMEQYFFERVRRSLWSSLY